MSKLKDWINHTQKTAPLKKRKSKFQRHFQLSFSTSSEWCFNTAETDSSTCVRVNLDVALDGYQIFMFEQKIIFIRTDRL